MGGTDRMNCLVGKKSDMQHQRHGIRESAGRSKTWLLEKNVLDNVVFKEVVLRQSKWCKHFEKPVQFSSQTWFS